MKLLRKLVLAIIGLAFAFAVSSCKVQRKKCVEAEKCCEEKQERHHRRW